MPRLRIRLQISPQELLRYYGGDAHEVVATAVDGCRVRFPARALRPHVTAQGVVGEFELAFDADHRLRGLRRVG